MIFRMLKVSVNGESQRLVVREITDNTDLENVMMDCWVLVFALDNKQSFGKKLTSSRTAPSQAKARPVVCIGVCPPTTKLTFLSCFQAPCGQNLTSIALKKRQLVVLSIINVII